MEVCVVSDVLTAIISNGSQPLPTASKTALSLTAVVVLSTQVLDGHLVFVWVRAIVVWPLSEIWITSYALSKCKQ